MKPIYLEPDEEITSVIEKISAEGDGSIALVVPKNSSLFQSLVNLKLLAKEAKNLQKEVAIISGNKVGMRLAKQVGVPAFATLGAISSTKVVSPEPTAQTPVEEVADSMIDGVPVRQYNPNRPVEAATPTEETPPVEENLPNQEIEIPPAEEIEEAEEPEKIITVDTPSEETTPEKETEKEEVPASSDLPPVITRTGTTTAAEPFRIPWKALIIAAVILLFMSVVTFFLLPKAKVTVVLPAEPVSDTMLLGVQAESAEGAIKGNLISSEQTATKSITATGKKDVGTKASGTINIINKYRDNTGAGKDQSFAAGTKVTDNSTKKVFTLNSAVTVSRVTFNPNNGQPIYDTKSVKVTAVEPGESYNIPKSSFSIAGALENTVVESSEAFSGGLTKQITVLSQDDVDKAINEAKAEMETKAKEDLATKATNLLIIQEGIWQTVKEQTTDKKVDQEAQSATLNLKIDFATYAFEQNLAVDQLKAKLSETLTDTQELVFEDGKEPTITFKEISQDKSKLTIEVAGNGYKVEKIDKAAIAKSIKNKSVDSAKVQLKETYQAQNVDISVTPGWWFQRLPFLPGAISVEYGFTNTTPEEATEPTITE